RKRRLESAADARLEIEDALTAPRTEATLASPLSTSSRFAWIAFAAAVLVAVGLGVPALRYLTEAPPAAPEMRLEITTPAPTDPLAMRISPYAQKIVSPATEQGRTQLWVRVLYSVSSRPLLGTDGARYPFWSRDSRSLGFLGDNQLKRIDLDGGSIQV